MILWLVHLLVNHPYIILGTVSIFSGACLIAPFTIRPVPNFADPQQGFETRGTLLANRMTAWRNLEESTKSLGPFTVNPSDFKKFKKKIVKPTREPEPTQVYGKQKIYISEEALNRSELEIKDNKWATLNNLVKTKSLSEISKRPKKQDYFCGSPGEVYIRVVLESNLESDLFTLSTLLTLCEIETKLTQINHYEELCVQTVKTPKRCCKPWSIANYVAMINNRTSCSDITEDDVNNTKDLLKGCSRYYHNFQLGPECVDKSFCQVPHICAQNNAVYNILNFLTSTSFLPSNTSSDMILKQTMIFLPVATSTAVLPYYHALDVDELKSKGISIVAMEFGIKSTLFDEYLKHDTWLMSMGITFVLICIWIYTKSMFLTLMTIIAMTFSLGIAYFTYTLIFEMKFFPFMNLLVAVVAIGIGADDAFIFCKVWGSLRNENNDTLTVTELLTHTFQRVFVSILITSITTAAAFFSSYISSVTTIRCFSVFATTAVVVNLFLMLTWLPACIVIIENSKNKCSFSNNWLFPLSAARRRAWEESFPQYRCALSKWWNYKEKFLIDAVIKFHRYWLVALTTLTMCSAFIVLYYPMLQLPDSVDFQLFDSSHLFERYDAIYKNMFWFSKSDRIGDGSNANKLPLRFVWGVLPVDDGNFMDPTSLGNLRLDNSFNVSTKASQEWLLQFCRQIRKQIFYQSTSGPLLANCFIESFMAWMERRCLDPISNEDLSPCCETAKFPYEASVFNTCIASAMGDLFDTPTEYFMPGSAGPKFSKDPFPTIKALVVEYDSSYIYSMSYEHMNDFYETVEAWTLEQLKTAPPEMSGGWFVSDFQFYDLQRALSQSTITSIGVSMGLSFVVLMLATFNILTSIYAVITICSTILVIVAILVLLGWQLNVLESIAICTAIGLAVDFSLHYIIHYGLSPSQEDRKASTRYALTNMAGPACMAAATTSAAGAFMMPSCILPYIQIGVFLLTVMSVSWFYATFFLCSLLAIAGPENHYGRCSLPNFCRIRKPIADTADNERGNRLISSVTDTVELDSLTSKCDRSSNNYTKSSTMECLNVGSPSVASATTIFVMDNVPLN